jgi:hypothetical protein
MLTLWPQVGVRHPAGYDLIFLENNQPTLSCPSSQPYSS